jgi:hypothetical protein
MRGFDHAFGVWHHSKDIARVVNDPGDIARATINGFVIAEHDAPFALAKTEKEADQLRDLSIRSHALPAALDAEMDRVMIRARDGHAYKDKIDLVSV